METEAKGWSVPTCSQEEPWRRVGEEMQRGQWDSLPSLSSEAETQSLLEQ